ncbi:hypothetical protein AA309_26605 [Microvirga vignae]|uniref:Uncharacterized protein n=1 Tax=Microvirga vignae TaxID=1225564 RepID=A0A0H1R5K0_9HYPH|nr:hypothetical protein [Microvirga vignae]KLK90304.1 hypothetical protein AA309_26605 [Microvirga vignae]
MMMFDISRAAQSRYDRLRREWPYDPTIDWGQVEALFFVLSVAEQDHCSRLASRYVLYCRRSGRRLKGLAKWIETRGWAGFLDVERRAVQQAGSRQVPVWVIEGTRAWDAWQGYRQARGQRMPSPDTIRAERGRGWWFPSLFPPDAAEQSYQQVRDAS